MRGDTVGVDEERIELVGKKRLRQFAQKHLQQTAHHIDIPPASIRKINLQLRRLTSMNPLLLHYALRKFLHLNVQRLGTSQHKCMQRALWYRSYSVTIS